MYRVAYRGESVEAEGAQPVGWWCTGGRPVRNRRIPSWPRLRLLRGALWSGALWSGSPSGVAT